MIIRIDMPEEAIATYDKLVNLHPGKSRDAVLVRALTLYHALYNAYLEENVDPSVRMMMDYLDELDEKDPIP